MVVQVDREGVNTNHRGRRRVPADGGGGWAIHLAPLATDPERNGFRAVLPEWFEERSLLATRARYDVIALTDARWWPKTLCGRAWYSMAAGSAGPLSEVAWEALAPDCRRCMASIDWLLPSVPPDDRIEPLCDQIVQTRRPLIALSQRHAPASSRLPGRDAGHAPNSRHESRQGVSTGLPSRRAARWATTSSSCRIQVRSAAGALSSQCARGDPRGTCASQSRAHDGSRRVTLRASLPPGRQEHP
jgi:hypothetical protein